MSDNHRPLDAVGHPVRLRILQRLADGQQATVLELAEAAGVHENTVRAHVAVLEEAELVASEPKPNHGPGRPGVQYRLTPAGEHLDDNFLGLAELLAVVIGRAGITEDQVREIGREWGRYLAGRPGRYDIEERVPEVLGRLGYDAQVDDGRVRLRGCPCPSVASDRPELICGLATGVLEGVLAAAGASLAVGSRRHDPVNRDCEIRLIDVTGGVARSA